MNDDLDYLGDRYKTGPPDGKKYNEPVSFRPSTEDRRILDRILTWLSSQTGMDYSNKHAAAIRKALSVTDAWLDRKEE